MKLRNTSLLALFTALCTMGIQAGENPFAPQNHPLPSPATSAPMSSHEQIAAPSSLAPAEPANPFAPTSHDAPANLEDHAIAPKADENHVNPFAPENHAVAPHVMEPEHHEQAEKDHAITSPFSPHMTSLEDHAITPKAKADEHHETMKPAPSMPHQVHISTAQKTASIKTLTITPGHSAALEPISETERYFIQDKKFESYLSNHIEVKKGSTERTYHVTIPATVHVGSFTVFKVQGTQGTPDHFQPAYHVEIQGNMHEVGTGTQYPEPQGSALEKLTQLEDKYLTGIQTEFKAFTQEVRELISTAHQNGESLEAAKLHVTQIVATKEPLQLAIGESHVATSFTGGSAQSSNPAIVSAVLKYDGTKTDPKWKLVLTGHKAGEAIITYSSGSESNLQPVMVVEKSSAPHTSAHKTVVKEAVPSHEENSMKTTSKKGHHALPAHDDNEEEAVLSPFATHHHQGYGTISEASNFVKTSADSGPQRGSSEGSEEEGSEETDEKTTNKLANADAPFASFLKESPEEEAASNDEEPTESATEAKTVTDDADEEPAEDQDQEEDK